MSLKSFLTSNSIEKGLISKFDRQNKFRLRKTLDKDGFHSFVLENLFRKERLIIKKFIFDRFRGQISQVLLDLRHKELKQNEIIEIKYKTKILFELKFVEESMVIKSHIEGHESSIFTCDLPAVKTLHNLLYSEDLQHPNEVLDRIVTYHKLFQFTFDSGSESITSDLVLKKNVLSSVERYIPNLKRSNGFSSDDFLLDQKAQDSGSDRDPSMESLDKTNESSGFQSRLGEKSGDRSYKVDFEKIFDGNFKISSQLSKTDRNQKKVTDSNHFPIPLLSSDIKLFRQVPFKCEFSKKEIEDFREIFLKSRNQEIFIGFEIMEAIYKTDSGRLSCYKFPLYYMKVKISESGRNIILTPIDESKIYLNHLAIANLIEKFAKSKIGSDGIDSFFKNLLAQNIEIEGEMSRIYISRELPCSDDVFQKTREVLLGYPGENGMGGLLGKLKLIGIECDLESVYLYKSTKIGSPVTASLEKDLDDIVGYATNKPDRFNKSLLGEFLAPGVTLQKEKSKFCQTPWIPGSLPKSTKRLVDKLNSNDLILLEGPPGTGKTFSIMNLFIHCLCTKKRLLVVSDQKGAIHALTEKIQEYLMGKDRVSAEANAMEALWRSAIKVVDEIPNENDKLSRWIQDLKEMLGAENPIEVAQLKTDVNYEGSVSAVDKEIRALKRAIDNKMHKHLGEQAQFQDRVTSKMLHATTQKRH